MKSFIEKYKKIIPEKNIIKIRKMARKGKGWGWKRNYLGKL